MAEQFDPYLHWLGIRDSHRPLNHYQLLGLPLFEPDPYAIAQAADRQMQYVGQYQNTAYGSLAQQILGQLAEAKSCLLNPQTRTDYDAWLQAASVGPAAIPTAPADGIVGPAGFPTTGSVPLAAAPLAAAPLPAAPVANDLPASLFGPAVKASQTVPETELIPGERSSKVVAMAIVGLVGLVLLLLGLIVLVASRRGLLGQPQAALVARTESPKPEAQARADSPPPAGRATTTSVPATPPKSKAASSAAASAEAPAVPQPAEPQTKSAPDLAGGQPPAKSEAKPAADAAAGAAADKAPGGPGDQKAGAGVAAGANTPAPVNASGQAGANEAPSAAQGSEKVAVPSRAARIHARQEVRKIYHDEYEAAAAGGKQKSLAEKLLAVGVETQDDPETRYALFYEARELAISATDAKLLRKSIESLAKYYKVDPLEELTRSLAEATEERMAIPAKKVLAPLALDLAKEAAAADDYAGAERLAEAAKEMAQGRDLAIVKQASSLLERLAEESQRYSRVQEAQKVLVQQPDDPAANLVVGQFYCFAKTDETSFARGLPLLVKGSDATLKALAAAELAPGRDASNSAEMIKLADLWYQGASAAEASRRADLLRRAAYWYRTALPELQGFSKSKSQRRLEEIERKVNADSDEPSGRRK